MHIMAGLQRTRLIFYAPGAMATPYHEEKLFGPVFGGTLDMKYFFLTFLATHIDPGPIEKEGDWESISPTSYFSASLGFRF